MLIPPKYNITDEIISLLASIDSSKEVIESLQIPPEVEKNIMRQSTLKSSLFSAKIEGNELQLSELTRDSKNAKKVEVYNILTALNNISKASKKDISTNDIVKMHSTVMKGLSEDAGTFRKEQSAIFNSAGIAIYMPPPASRVEAYVSRLLKYANSDKEKFVPIKAALTHYNFEKIHPFLDGNGRVGRLLMQRVLHREGYGMKGLIAIEEKINEKRSMYYSMLEEPEKDATDYVTFILDCLSEAAIEAKEIVKAKQKSDVSDFLLPRRAEIFQIIRDQKMVNFDQIRRRFPRVNERTLRYDLKKLQDEGLIIKLGSTKGVYYKTK